MYSYRSFSGEYKSKPPAQAVARQGSSAIYFVDNRPQAVVQKKQYTPYLVDNRPGSIVQKKQMEAFTNSYTTKAPVQQKSNNTGLPDNLKSGIENLSGHSMDDVKVHYNSSQPAQLNAHAYAQGTDIHLASGQEKHLPHEAWHVVQQKQGRVRPTMQMKGKVNVNDDKGLEQEADVMGAKAIQGEAGTQVQTERKQEILKKVAQRKGQLYQTPHTLRTLGKNIPVQRVLSVNVHGTRDEAALAPIIAATHLAPESFLHDPDTNLWYRYIARCQSDLFIAEENGSHPSTYDIGTGVITPVNCTNAQEFQAVIAGISDLTNLMTLFQDGASGAQLQAIFAYENNGVTIHQLIQAEATHNVQGIIQLYNAGATSAEIATLLGHGNNAATVHQLIQAEATHNAQRIIQLYVRGFTSAHITAMLVLEPNAQTIEDYLQTPFPGFTIGNLLFASMANNCVGSIYFTNGRIRLTHNNGPQVTTHMGITRHTISEADYQQYRQWEHNGRLGGMSSGNFIRARPSFVPAVVGAGERLVEFWPGHKHISRGGPVAFNHPLTQAELNILCHVAHLGNNNLLRAWMAIIPGLTAIPIH